MSEEEQKKPIEQTVEAQPDPAKLTKKKPAETGGPEGPEPTRYGDWERKGIAVDF